MLTQPNIRSNVFANIRVALFDGLLEGLPNFALPTALILPETFNTALITMDNLATTNEIIHTSPIFIQGGWGPDGHEYWCAGNAYPAFNNQRENPGLLSSADGITWVEPTGLTNPLEGPPGGGDYNADVTLRFDFFAQRMHVYWTQNVGVGSHYYWRHCSSLLGDDFDGTGGSEAPSVVKDGTVVAGAGDAASPAIVERVGGATTFGAWSVDVSAGGAGPYVLEFRGSNNHKAWDVAPTAVTLGGKLPAHFRPWHVWVGVKNGRYVMLLCAQPKKTHTGVDTGPGSDVSLWGAVSNDPLNFEFYHVAHGNRDNSATADWMWDSVYRSGMFLDGPRAGDVMVSAYAGTVPHIERAERTKVSPVLPALDWAVAPVGKLALDYPTVVDVTGVSITGVNAWTGGATDSEEGFVGAGTLELSENGIEVRTKGVYWGPDAAVTNVTFIVMWKDNVEDATTPVPPEMLIRCNSIGMARLRGLTQMNYFSGAVHTGINAPTRRPERGEWRLGVYSYDGTHLSQWLGVKGDNPMYTRTTQAKLANLAAGTFRGIGNTILTASVVPTNMTLAFFGVVEAGFDQLGGHEIWRAFEPYIPVTLKFLMDGIDDQVQIDNADYFSEGSPHRYKFKVNGLAQTSATVIGNGSSTTDTPYLPIGSGPVAGGFTDKIYVVSRNDLNVTKFSFGSTAVVFDGVEREIELLYDGLGNWDIYIDGVFDSTSNFGLAGVAWTTNQNRIGCLSRNQDGSPDVLFFKGTARDIEIDSFQYAGDGELDEHWEDDAVRQLATLESQQLLPDGQASDTNKGITGLGLAVAPDNSLWVSNHGDNLEPSAAPYLASILHLSADGSTTLLEINASNPGGFMGTTGTIQGVAYDTSDGTLWCAGQTDGLVYHIELDGTLIGSFAFTGVNGIAYDSLSDSLWCSDTSSETIVNVSKVGAVIKTVPFEFTTIFNDHLTYDAETNSIWVSYEGNGTIGKIIRYDKRGFWDLPITLDASANKTLSVEGIAFRSGKLLALNDGYFHTTGDALNELHEFTLAQDPSTASDGTVVAG